MSKFVIRLIVVLVTIFATHNANADPLEGSLETLFSELDGILGTDSRSVYDNDPSGVLYTSAVNAYKSIQYEVVDTKRPGNENRSKVLAAFQKYRNANKSGTSYFNQLPLNDVLTAWGIND